MCFTTFMVTIGTVNILKHLAIDILFAFYNNNCKNIDRIITIFYLNFWSCIHTLGPEKNIIYIYSYDMIAVTKE